MVTKPTGCDVDQMLAPFREKEGLIGKLAAGMSEPPKGMHKWPDGTFRSAAPPNVQLAEVQQARCFQTGRYSVGDRGLHSVNEVPRKDDAISLPRYLALGDDAARRVREASPADRDKALLDYFKSRKTFGEVIHRFFGEPGLEVAAARYGDPAHQAATDQLRVRFGDGDFAPTLSPLERAEIELLATSSQDFISCTARRGRKQ
jgi:hypothetical protein